MPGEPVLFDSLAANYDAAFSNRLPAKWLRTAVHARIAPLIAPGSRVLDAGCGTGLDAVWLAEHGCDVVAADASRAMLEVCREQIARHGLERRVRLHRLDLADPAASAGLPAGLDLVLSNFGVLNCLADPAPFFELARARLRPGGFVAAVVMGRFCLAETLHFVWRGELERARRRRGRAELVTAGARGTVWYHAPRTLLEAARGFERHGLYGVGAFLPPSELFGACERFPRLTSLLARLDRGAARITYPLSDHYLLILRRR